MKTTFDFSPLWRSTVGFDRVFEFLDQFQPGQDENYPPTNIERTGEDHYRISLALAGFKPEEITITAHENVLTVEGSKAERGERDYLHHGFSERPFIRQFSLAEHVEVKDARFSNGLLEINLVREVPEAMKPRRIAINAGGAGGAARKVEKAAA